MGLKTTNYQVERLGITLPEAYAIIDKIELQKTSARVTFAVQATREATAKKAPLETKVVHVAWDRKTDIAKLAYEAAKTRTVEHTDPVTQETVTTEIKGVFDGWEDDIVE